MRDSYGITIAGGQAKLKGRIARLAHCGYFGAFDILLTLSAFEMTLSELGTRPRAGRRCGRRAAGVPRGGRARLGSGVSDGAAGPRTSPGQGEDRRLGRRSCCATPGSTWRSASDWSQEELESRIGEFDGILIRSATKLTADLIGKATRLRVVGRAGVGVDNVDVDAATKRGVVVANAPQSNVITAAEHTIALLLALARRVPQAHASLIGGAWERSSFSGVELYEKTLGVLGFGRIGQLVAQRALGFGMHVVAFDAYVAEERFREVGVERAETSDELYDRADFVTIHLPVTDETRDWLDADAFARMKDGVRVINVARGGLLVDADLKAALDSGKVAGAALDVFREEPVTEHPLFGYPNVVVTPHLGASTTEATDRAGYQAAEQVRGGAHRRRGHLRRQHPVDRRRGPRGAGRLPAARARPRPDRHGTGRGHVRGRARGGVPRAHRRARHAPAHRAGAQGRAGRAHRGGDQRRERARRSPRSAGSRSRRRAPPRRATSPTSCA